MKILQKSLVVLLLLVIAGGLLVWFLPARLALLWIKPPHNLRLQQVHGLLWDGSGQLVTASGQPLGQLHWVLPRAAMLGKVQLQADFSGPQLDFSGSMQKHPDGQVEWRDVRARVDLALLDRYAALPMGQPRGELHITVAHALLEGGWPMQLAAKAQWSDAAMHRPGGDIALGSLALEAHSSNGVIAAQLHDDGHGPLAAVAALQLSPLGWRLDGTLRSRQTEPGLSHWLDRLGLGHPDASGAVQIQHSGGMAIGLPAATPSRTP